MPRTMVRDFSSLNSFVPSSNLSTCRFYAVSETFEDGALKTLIAVGDVMSALSTSMVSNLPCLYPVEQSASETAMLLLDVNL